MSEGQEIPKDKSSEKQDTLAEREAIKDRIERIVEIGKPILVKSNLVEPEAKIASEDLEILKKFYDAVAPTPEKWPQTGSNWSSEYGPWEHAQLAGIAARYITEKLQEGASDKNDEESNTINALNADEMEALGLLHDLGRLVIHDMYRSDVVSDMLFKKLRIRDDLKMKLHSVDFFYGRSLDQEGKRTFVNQANQITVEQRIMKMADTLGKRQRSTGKVQTVSEFLAGHDNWVEGYKDRPPKKWGTEKQFRRIIDQYATADREIVISIKDWMSGYGVNVDTVSEEIGQGYQELQSPQTAS